MIFDMKNAFTLVLGVKAFQRVEKENAAVKFAQKLQKTSYVQNVPPERFEGLICIEL